MATLRKILGYQPIQLNVAQFAAIFASVGILQLIWHPSGGLSWWTGIPCGLAIGVFPDLWRWWRVRTEKRLANGHA